MLGVQEWLADVGGPPSVAVWLTWDAACSDRNGLNATAVDAVKFN